MASQFLAKTAVSEQFGVTLGPAEPEKTEKDKVEETTPPPRPRARRPAAAVAPPAEVTPPAEAVDVAAPPVEVAATPDAPVETAVAEPVTISEPEVTRLLDSTLYSAADTDVVPPIPPIGSPLRPWRVGNSGRGLVMEVTVAHDGSVEKVQMLSAARLSDAQLLSHIKSWRFAPAVRDGEPVRYRLLLHDPILAP
jgi:hypothetical protein